MSLSGCQINPIDVNFHLQKSLEIFYTNLNTKITRGVKVPCLMPIRVNINSLYDFMFAGKNISDCYFGISCRNVLNIVEIILI